MTNSSESGQESIEQQVKNLQMENKIFRQLLTNLGFEIRTPANVIIGYSTILLDEQEFDTLNEKQVSSLDYIRKSAQRVLDIFEDINNTMRIVLFSQWENFRPEKVNLGQLIEELNITTDQLTIENIPNVWADKRLLLSTLDMLFSVPEPTNPTRKILIESTSEPRFVTIHYDIGFYSKYYDLGDDPRLLVCQIGINQQGGFLDLEESTKSAIRIKVGLPVSEKT
ncbi:MAG: hypothetical protein GY796_16935 [Chloroflexi bacterium]|nr:hypothetical protein [Chloroflexota bacterium]